MCHTVSTGPGEGDGWEPVSNGPAVGVPQRSSSSPRRPGHWVTTWDRRVCRAGVPDASLSHCRDLCSAPKSSDLPPIGAWPVQPLVSQTPPVGPDPQEDASSPSQSLQPLLWPRDLGEVSSSGAHPSHWSPCSQLPRGAGCGLWAGIGVSSMSASARCLSQAVFPRSCRPAQSGT